MSRKSHLICMRPEDESISWQNEDEVREEVVPIDDFNEYTASYILQHIPIYSVGNARRMAYLYKRAKTYLIAHESKKYEINTELQLNNLDRENSDSIGEGGDGEGPNTFFKI